MAAISSDVTTTSYTGGRSHYGCHVSGAFALPPELEGGSTRFVTLAPARSLCLSTQPRLQSPVILPPITPPPSPLSPPVVVLNGLSDAAFTAIPPPYACARAILARDPILRAAAARTPRAHPDSTRGVPHPQGETARAEVEGGKADRGGTEGGDGADLAVVQLPFSEALWHRGLGDVCGMIDECM